MIKKKDLKKGWGGSEHYRLVRNFYAFPDSEVSQSFLNDLLLLL